MDKKEIILCYPALNRNPKERDYHWFPFSVLPLAQALSAYRYTPIVIDFRVDPYPLAKLKAHLKKALFVGISAMSGYQIAGGLKIAKIVRGLNPSLPIIWGGWHPTILPQDTARHPLVDLVVAGNGENTIINVSKAIGRKEDLRLVKGVAFKDGGRVVFTGYRQLEHIKDAAQRYDRFINIFSYINPETRALGYFSSHGCIYGCGFCSRHFMTRKYCAYPAKKVKQDVKYFVKNYGFRKIHFQDDNFFIDRERVFEIAGELNSLKKDLTWWANVRSDVMQRFSKKQLGFLIKGGLAALFIGAESASQRLLDLMNKGIAADDVIRASDTLKDHRVALHISYMAGIPGENIKDIRKTVKQIKLLKKINKNVKVQVCFYQPYPGTELYKKALEFGYPKLTGLLAWSRMRPQQEFSRIPWLNKGERKSYQNELKSLFKESFLASHGNNG